MERRGDRDEAGLRASHHPTAGTATAMRADGMRTAHCILQPGSERKEGIWSVKRRSSVLERTPPCAAVKQSSPSASAAAWLFFSTLLFGSQCFPAQRVASLYIHPVEPSRSLSSQYNAARPDRCAPPNLSHKVGWMQDQVRVQHKGDLCALGRIPLTDYRPAFVSIQKVHPK